MAHGRKRIWLARCLLAVATVACLGIAASRWFGLSCDITLPNSAHRTSVWLSDGLIGMYTEQNTGRAPGDFKIDFQAERKPPDGPLLIDPPLAPGLHKLYTETGVTIGSCWPLGQYQFKSGRMFIARAVVWPLPVTLIVTALLLRRSALRAQRHGSGNCVHCNYDRSATPPTSPCPECGQAPPSPRAASTRGQVPEGR
jgi:hypothetical protein